MLVHICEPGNKSDSGNVLEFEFQINHLLVSPLARYLPQSLIYIVVLLWTAQVRSCGRSCFTEINLGTRSSLGGKIEGCDPI